MSSEVCPHCGKVFKRLKSHLPYCKAARDDASSSASPPKTTKTKAEKEKSTHAPPVTASPQTKTKKKKQQTISEPSSVGVDSPPSSTKAKSKPATSAPASSSSPPSLTKPTKKNVRAPVEAAKPNKEEDSARRTAATSPDPLSLSEPSSAKTAVLSRSKRSVGKTSPTAAPSEEVQTTWREAIKSESGSDERFWLDVPSDGQHLTGRPRVTLQDVKSTLGRPHSSRPAILDRPGLAKDLLSGTTPLPGPGAEAGRNTSAEPEDPNQARLKLEPLFPPQWSLLASELKVDHGVPSQGLSPETASQARPTSGTSSPGPLLLSAQTLPKAAAAATERPRLAMEERNAADNRNEGVQAQQILGQARRRELPGWFASNAPGRPRDVAERLQKGWQEYYRKYIHQRKATVGGVGVLVAGICVLGYIWTYRDRKDDHKKKEGHPD